MFDLLITGGTAVLPERAEAADIGVAMTPRSAQCKSSRIRTSGAVRETAIRNCATASNNRKVSASVSSGGGSGMSPITS